MRIVAGTHGGRRLTTPSGDHTRPTSDRVREAVGNALGSLGVFDNARVLDLFAGSGALGIEALSRGAAAATFVDADQRAVDVIGTNLDTLGLRDVAHVCRGDVVNLLEGGTGTLAISGLAGPFDLVFADPPYAFDDWDRLSDALAASLADEAVLVIESDRVITLGSRWQKLRERAYGGTVVSFARHGAVELTGGDV